jgi:hypothetical protein
MSSLATLLARTPVLPVVTIDDANDWNTIEQLARDAVTTLRAN